MAWATPCIAARCVQDEEVRQQARAQLAVLFAKLDSLSHLHFT
jgi:hypothetical protein